MHCARPGTSISEVRFTTKPLLVYANVSNAHIQCVHMVRVEGCGSIPYWLSTMRYRNISVMAAAWVSAREDRATTICPRRGPRDATSTLHK